MAVTTKDGAELRRKDVHQVLQPEVLPQVLDVDLGPWLAHRLALDTLLCRLIGPNMANIRLAALYDMLTSCPAAGQNIRHVADRAARLRWPAVQPTNVSDAGLAVAPAAP